MGPRTECVPHPNPGGLIYGGYSVGVQRILEGCIEEGNPSESKNKIKHLQTSGPQCSHPPLHFYYHLEIVCVCVLRING